MSERAGLPEFDRMVHEPARLAILTVLSACERADFLFLERATGLTRGNLSVQLTRLEEAGLIEIEKTIVRKRTLTTAALLETGRLALDAYWEAMQAMEAMRAGRRGGGKSAGDGWAADCAGNGVRGLPRVTDLGQNESVLGITITPFG